MAERPGETGLGMAGGIGISGADLPGSTQAHARRCQRWLPDDLRRSRDLHRGRSPPVAISSSAWISTLLRWWPDHSAGGAGYDLEDGLLSDLTWYSDRDGVLGTGPVPRAGG